MNKRLIILSILFAGFSQFGFAQIKEEKLILDRKREPEIRKIQKKQTSVATIKNYPPKEKRTQDSLNLRYDIQDVPAVSDFKPSTIQGADISPNFQSSYQKNYLRAGMGNYGKTLADANISTILKNKLEVGVDAHFVSTTGLKKEYPWDSGQAIAEFGAFLNYYGNTGKINVNADYELSDYKYYGIYALAPAANIGLSQKVNQVSINGFYDHFSNEILDDVRVKTNFLTDHFGARESALELATNLTKNNIHLGKDGGGMAVDFGLGLGAEMQNTNFDLLNKNAAAFVLLKAEPSVSFNLGNSHLKLGTVFNYLNNTQSDKNGENIANGKSKFYLNAELQVGVSEQFNIYAGMDGGAQLNSYASLLAENPYLVSDQVIKPTETKYSISLGVKGDVNKNMKYNISGTYAKVNDAVFYIHNDLFDYNNTLNRSAYNFANVLSTVYGSGTMNKINADLKWYPIQNLDVEGAIEYQKYNAPEAKNTYNEDGITASIGAKYRMLNQKLLLEFKTVFDTGNTVDVYDLSILGTPGAYVSTKREVDVPGYADLNLSAEYKVHKNLSIFALGNNLLNKNYQNFYGYKKLGVQITGGIKFSF